MIEIMIGNNEKRLTKMVDENQTPAQVFAATNLYYADSGIELNGMRLSAEEANRSTLADLGARNNDILMYNKKNDNG